MNAEQLESKCLWAASFLLLIAFAYLSYVTHWADSELWTISVARQFGSGRLDAGSQYKILFEALIHQIYRFDLSDEATVDMARFLFMLNGLALVALTAILARKLLPTKGMAIYAVFLLITCSFFLSQGFRVRSDLLAAAFQLSGLWAYLNFKSTNSRRWLWAAMGTAFHVAAFLATPKAVYHLALNAVFIYQDRGFQRIGRARWVWIVAALAAVVTCAAVIAANSDSFKYALKFFVQSFFTDSSRPGYFSSDAVFYLVRFVNENLTFAVAIAFLIVATARAHKKHEVPPVAYSACLALVFIFLHNDRLPFFILSLLPLVAIACVGAVLPALQWVSNQFGAAARGILLAMIFLTATTYARRVRSFDSNADQRVAMKVVREYLEKYPGTKYFDATAALPRTTQIMYHIEVSGHDSWGTLMRILPEENPEVIFFGNRFFYHFDNITVYLARAGYVHAGGGTYVRAGKMRTEFDQFEEENLKALCPQPDSPRYYYAGVDSLNTYPVTLSEALALKGKAGILACSKFPPVKFTNGKSFAQIFDYDQNY